MKKKYISTCLTALVLVGLTSASPASAMSLTELGHRILHSTISVVMLPVHVAVDATKAAGSAVKKGFTDVKSAVQGKADEKVAD